MSSLTSTTWSPNSYLLRHAYHTHRSKRRPSRFMFVRTHVLKQDSHVRVYNSRNGKQRRGGGDRKEWSWRMSLDPVFDNFKGWSSPEEGAEVVVGESEKRPFLGGVVGAGVAGVILVAGVTFAAFSLSKQNASRSRLMEPLTTQQEQMLATDPQDNRVENRKDDIEDIMKESNSLEHQTGIDEDSYSSPEIFQDSIETNLIDGNDMEIASVQTVNNSTNGSEAISKAFAQEDLPDKSASNGTLADPNSSISSSSDISDDPFAISGFKHSSLNLDVSHPESIVECREDLVNVESNRTSFSNSNPTYIDIDKGDKILGSSPNAPIPTEPVTLNISGSSQLDETLDSQTLENGEAESETLTLNKDVDLNSTPLVTVEENISYIGVYEVSETKSSGMSVSTLAEPSVNERINASSKVNKDKSFFYTQTPWNSLCSAGVPAPSVVSVALQVLPGKVLVPAVVDQAQGQALAALQVLKVIEPDVQPGDLCTRREYARWLVSASSALSRNTALKVYPAMYIENVTELAFDDITPEDPDFSSIQGLAEAGLIASKLSIRDMYPLDEEGSPFSFSPESPLSRQDLVCWKMALEKRQLPEADRKLLYQVSGFIDIDKINPDAWPALVADVSSGEQGIITLAFGFTRLFQPDKPVTKAQAAIAIATSESSDIVNEELARIEAESMAEKAVAAHSALVAQVEEDISASFEKELFQEREKISAVEKMAEEAKNELDKLRAQREEESIALMKERASVDSEMEVLSRLRREVEEQLQSVMSNKVEITYEKERINKLWKEAENENQEIARLQYELEVERKALSLARSWAEDEARRAREQAKALEEARDRWEKHGIKVVVDDDLREDASSGVTWLNAGKQLSVEGTVSRAETSVNKLKAVAINVPGKSQDMIKKVINKILDLISFLREWASKATIQVGELKDYSLSKARESTDKLQRSTTEVSFAIKEGGKRAVGECREGVEKLTQKFKNRSV